MFRLFRTSPFMVTGQLSPVIILHITVMDDDFNLGVLTMRTPEGVFETDFGE